VPITDPKNTLAFHQSRVLTTHRNMSKVPLKDVAPRLTKALSSMGQTTSPENEALWFYGMNHGMALISAEYAPYEPLPPDVLAFVEAYHSSLADKAVRAFFYLLVICARESRHNNSKGAALTAELQPKYGPHIAMFHSKVSGGEMEAVSWLKNASNGGTIGQMAESLSHVFYKCKWSGGFGGKAWGKVADCLARFVRGEFSAEMMLDTIWTLCHNNGPIFNKGHLYAHHGGALIKLLDVQRSGQIPEAIKEGIFPGHVEDDLKVWMDRLYKMFPGKLGDYVDWYVVEALGSNQKYAKEKAAQQAKYGLSPKASEMQKMAAQKEAQALAKKKAAEEAAALALAEKMKNSFEVTPGVYVQKFQPERKEAA
jgi:hypothetical protein